jgi:hypothetical protein
VRFMVPEVYQVTSMTCSSRADPTPTNASGRSDGLRAYTCVRATRVLGSVLGLKKILSSGSVSRFMTFGDQSGLEGKSPGWIKGDDRVHAEDRRR